MHFEKEAGQEERKRKREHEECDAGLGKHLLSLWNKEKDS